MELVKSLFHKDLIFMEKVQNQHEIFNIIGSKLQEMNIVNDKYVEALLERERNFPTGLDLSPVSRDILSVAIPHTEIEYCNNKCIAFVKLHQPIVFNSMTAPDDEIDVKYLFFIINDQKDSQTNVLSELMSFLTNPKNIMALDALDTTEDIYNFLSDKSI